MSYRQHIFLAFRRADEYRVRKVIEKSMHEIGESRKVPDTIVANGRPTQVYLLGISAGPAEPPSFAELVVAFLAKAKHKDALLGDLDEKFRGAIARGWTVQRARRMYWAEAMRAVGPLAWQKLKRLGIISLLTVAAKFFFG